MLTKCNKKNLQHNKKNRMTHFNTFVAVKRRNDNNNVQLSVTQ